MIKTKANSPIEVEFHHLKKGQQSRSKSTTKYNELKYKMKFSSSEESE